MFGIDDAIAAGSNLITTIVNKIAPDANIEERGKIEKALLELNNHYKLVLSQIDVNREDAKNSSVFVSGARPFILWMCGVSLGMVSIVYPLAQFVIVNVLHTDIFIPEVDTDLTLQLLLGLLGLGGLRTFEKTKGVARDKL